MINIGSFLAPRVGLGRLRSSMSVGDAPEDRLQLGIGTDESFDRVTTRVGFGDASREDSCGGQHNLGDRFPINRRNNIIEAFTRQA